MTPRSLQWVIGRYRGILGGYRGLNRDNEQESGNYCLGVLAGAQ